MDVYHQEYSSNRDYSISNYQKNIYQKTDVTSGSKRTVEVSLSNARPGDIFHGEILSVSGKNVVIQLGKEQILNALLGEKVPLIPGNEFFFEVKENNGKQVMIRPLNGEGYTPLDQTAQKALLADGLSTNSRNMELVKNMIDFNLPVDRNSVLKMINLVNEFPTTDIKTLLSLKVSQMPITQTSITQFEQYQSSVHQLTGKMASFAESLGNIFETAEISSTEENSLFSLNQQITKILTTENGSSTSLKEIYPDLFSNEISALSQASQEENTAEIQNAIQKPSADGIKNSLLQNTQNNLLSELMTKFETAGADKNELAKIFSPENTLEQTLKEMQHFFKEHSNLSSGEINKILSSKEYVSFLKNVMDSQWSLMPQQIKDSSAIDDLYQKIYRQTQEISNVVNNFSMSNQNFSDNSQNMKDSLNYIQQLNEMYTYAQVPISFNSGQANSELFVYTNKRLLSKDSKDLSVLLHLDMENMGPTDVKVSLSNKKVVTRFYLNDEDSLNLVQEHMEELSQRLSQIGFELQSEVVKRKDHKEEVITDFSNDFLLKDKPIGTAKRVQFDVKA